MKTEFSGRWQASKKPNKQRKFVYNAPLHIRGRLMASPLSKDLRKKYMKKSVRVRTGDRVKLMRGQFKGKIGVVEKVDLARYRVYVEKIEVIKKDGTKAQYPVHPSNLMIMNLNTDDKRRFGKVSGKASEKPASKKAKIKEQPVKHTSQADKPSEKRSERSDKKTTKR